jgi:hypothetical protein
MPSTAQKIIQMSYIELLYEHARPEPRLRRLLGHVGIYGHASRLFQERMQKSIVCFDREEEKMSEDESRQSQPVGTSFTEARLVWTFSDFQALIRSKLEHQQLWDVTATEVTGVTAVISLLPSCISPAKLPAFDWSISTAISDEES